MPGGSTAYLPTAQQFGGDEFDRSPVSFVSQQMFRFRQQATLVPFGPALTCTLDRQALDILLIASCAVPGVIARKTCLGRDATQGDEDFSFQPVLRRPNCAFAKFACAETFVFRQDGNAFHGAAEYQGHHGMSGFVVGGGLVMIVYRFHDCILWSGREFTRLNGRDGVGHPLAIVEPGLLPDLRRLVSGRFERRIVPQKCGPALIASARH